VNVLAGHFGVHEARVGCVYEDVGVGGGEVAGEVAGVENGGEFGAPVLAVGAEVGVEFGEGGEVAGGGRGLVGVGGEVDDADGGVRGGGFFEEGEEVRG